MSRQGRKVLLLRIAVQVALAVLPFSLSPCAAQTATPDAAPAAIAPRRSASIVLKVADYEAARRKAAEAATAGGAQYSGAGTRVNEKGRRSGSLEFTLPADRLPDFLSALRGIGTLYSERLFSRDDTSKHQSLGRRIGRLETHQKRLGGILKDTRRLRGSDILYVQERLFRAEVDESGLRQSRDDLQRAAETARVSVVLFEPVSVTRTEQIRRDFAAAFTTAMGSARSAAGKLFGKIVTASAYLLTFAPLWLPLALAAYFLIRRGRVWWKNWLSTLPTVSGQRTADSNEENNPSLPPAGRGYPATRDPLTDQTGTTSPGGL